MKIKKLSSTIAINIVVLAFLIGLLEAVCWIFVVKQGSNTVSSWRVNHTWKPNSTFEHSEWIKDNPDFPTPYIHYYNKQGWLEKYDIQKEKPPKTYRIFYVGDSFTEGTVAMEGSLPSLVEQALNAPLKESDYKIEVINTGTISYSPVIFYTLIRYIIAPYAPDLIVINVDMSDNFDDWKYQKTVLLDEQDNPLAVPPRNIYTDSYIDTLEGAVKATWRLRLRLFLEKNSFLYNLILRLSTKNTKNNPAKKTKPNFIYKRWAWCEEPWNAEVQENVAYTLNILSKIAAFCRDNKIKLALSSVPHFEQYAGAANSNPKWSARPHDEIRKIAEQEGLPYFNSFAELKPIIQGTAQSTYYYKNNMHFNPRGYQLWAETHIAALTRKDLNLVPDWYTARK